MQLRHRTPSRPRRRLAKLVAAGSVAALALNGGAADAADGCTTHFFVSSSHPTVCRNLLPGGVGVFEMGGGWFYVGDAYGGCTSVNIQVVCEVTISMSES
jgi:hypothetical protein